MGRNIRPDLERRFITYVDPHARDHADEWRVISWVRQRISKGAFDFALGTAGAGAALASVIFAGVMINGDTAHPTFGGSEYLLLFTRPLEHAGNQPIGSRYRERGIDYTATGSIGSAALARGDDTTGKNPSTDEAPAASAPLKDYVLTSVTGGVASIKSPKGAFIVETGSFMPNGDLVLSIDRRAGRWVVVTSGGLIESR